MRALIGGIGPGTPLGQLTFDLLSPTVARNGRMPFNEALLNDTLTDVLDKRAPKIEPIPEATEEQVALQRSGEIARLLARPTDVSSVGQDANYIIEVAQELEEKTQVRTAETFGQCLWRHRDEEVLTREPHRHIVEDLQWIEEPGEASPVLDMVGTVFKELTREKQGRMTARLWSKAVELMKGNPVIKQRVNRNDVDRVFHREAMREVRERGHQQVQGSDVGFSIGLSRFLGLLVDLAELMHVHAFMVFLAVGCHAEHLVGDRKERERKEREEREHGSASGSRPGSRSVPGSRAGSRGPGADRGPAHSRGPTPERGSRGPTPERSASKPRV